MVAGERRCQHGTWLRSGPAVLLTLWLILSGMREGCERVVLDQLSRLEQWDERHGLIAAVLTYGEGRSGRIT